MYMQKTMPLLLALLLWSGAARALQTDSLTLRIKGMRCDDCAHKVMKLISPLDGVQDLRFNIERRTATVCYDPTRLSPEAIRAALGTARYKPTPYSPDEVIRRGYGIHLADLTTEAEALRAMALLQGQAGVDSLAPHTNRRYLFVRYDANRTSKATLRQLLLDGGFTPTNYYSGNAVSYLDCILAPAMATAETLEQVVILDGVEDATINPARSTLSITFFTDETSTEQLLSSLRALGLDPVVR